MCTSAMSSCSYGLLVSTMSMERDKAWIVVASSAVIMFIGPSTLTSYGSLVTTVQVETNFPYRVWILNIMYTLFFATAILVPPLASMKIITYRKITLIGCVLTASGLILSGISLQSNPMWMFLTLSTFVGIGLGLTVSATFLLIALHFEKYRGLANGIGLMSAGVGNLLSPFIYDWIESSKDKFNLHALLIAVAFMTVSCCYISPPPLPTPVSSSESSRKKLNSKSSLIDKNKNEREKFPLVTNSSGGNELMPSSASVRPRRPSLFMANIASHLLPDILEETETSQLPTQNLYNDDTTNCAQEKMDKIETICSSGESHVKDETELKRNSIENNEPHSCINSPITKDHSISITVPPSNEDKKVLDSVSMSTPTISQLEELTRTFERARKASLDMTHNLTKIFKKTTECPLVKNITFWNMTLSGIVSVTVLNFPIILYSHVNQISSLQGHNNTNIYNSSSRHMGHDPYNKGELALNIIFTVDILSRLVFSFISDLPFFNRRLGFLASALCGAIIIVVIGFIQDVQLIYFLSIIYGISYGALIVTESLMFADVFGIEKLGISYGIVGLIKATLILIASSILQSPTSAFIYTIHPSLPSSSQGNETICNDCDPFDLYSMDNPDEASLHRQYLLGLTAIPGFICAITWSIEMLWTYLHSEKFQSQKNNKLEINSSPRVEI